MKTSNTAKPAKKATETKAIKATKAKSSTNSKKGKTIKPTKSVDKATIDAKNKKANVTAAPSRRTLKYVYPDGVIDALGRKDFRQKARNKINKLERDMRAPGIKPNAVSKLSKELNAYKAEVLAS